ncbi:hypothetical protein EYF80_031902 [Liparis tanakae]|uniref:Uncharacterized protein n=1 Tax=Liparis tanakae TaxID=230148 RepID=A0A4Z2GYQ0_9TELE|nr:hypothetical protein EYF80_031902 [Liparis tanakae]
MEQREWSQLGEKKGSIETAVILKASRYRSVVEQNPFVGKQGATPGLILTLAVKEDRLLGAFGRRAASGRRSEIRTFFVVSSSKTETISETRAEQAMTTHLHSMEYHQPPPDMGISVRFIDSMEEILIACEILKNMTSFFPSVLLFYLHYQEQPPGADREVC